MNRRPDLTIVVTIISNDTKLLRSCLETLGQQRFDGLEVLIPYDDPVANVTSLGVDYPWVEFIHAEGLDTAEARAGASREHHDTIRTIGLRRAQGAVVAMLEDVCRPEANWCRNVIAAFERHPNAGAIGGEVWCASDRILNRAVCLADFWRYQPPLTEQMSAFASDVNIGYRAEVLQSLRDVWDDDFHETVVNDELLERGHEVWLSPEMKIYQDRGNLTWREAIRERFVWGRSYGGTRVASLSFPRRVALAMLCPILPFVLWSRVLRSTWRGGRFWSNGLSVLTVALLLVAVWSYGEFVGYVTGRKD